MKKIFLLILTIFLISPAFADESLLGLCEKTYPISADNLYLLTLSCLNGTGQFEVIEMQSKNGYIVFRVNKKDYIVSISKNGSSSSIIKILPVNSDYSTGTAIQKAVFDTIELNIKNIPQKVL